LEVHPQKQFNINDYLRIFYRGRWIVFICLAVVVTYTVYYNITVMPEYEASALILLKKDNNVQRTIFNDANFGQPETMLHNHMEILKSRTLAKDVVSKLEALPQADSLVFLGNPPRVERFSFKRWFSATFRLAKSEKMPVKPSFERIVEKFRKASITVIPKDQTDMIELRVRAIDPYEAALIANTWMEAYQEMDMRESKGEISEVRQFLEKKLEDVQGTLSKSEDALKEYKQSEGVTELNAETQQMIQQMAAFEASYQEATTGLEANERRLSFLKSQLDENQKAMLAQVSIASSSVIQEHERQMAELIAQKAAYEQQLRGAGYTTDTDPKLKQMEQRLRGLQESIADEKRKLVSSGGSVINPLNFAESLINSILQIETENKSLKAKADAYYAIVQKYNVGLNSLPEKSLKLARFQREAEVNNNIFMMLREKFEESRIKEASQIGSIRIVDYAEPPKVPIKPDKMRNLVIGILYGFGLGIGIILVREYLDRTIKSIEDVERMGFPVLGSIPLITPRQTIKPGAAANGQALLIESRLITHFQPNSPVSESYRTLRTNIQYSNVDKPLKTILVTSPGPGEGKSTSVANLAITFAQMGAKSLLIDTDLRRPVLHGLFGIRRNEGLTNVLVGTTPIQEAIRRTQVKNLYLLTSGTIPKNPSEFLASKIMQKLILKISARFDIVLLDSPPVIAVTDSAVLASHLDGIILVIRSEKTDRDGLLRSVTLMKNVNAKILGILVNGLDIHHRYGSYYKYYTYSQ
jgi:capsular exopolysaccharide synthesis family protein